MEALGNLVIGDLLLASREDMVALLGLSDGVRLFLRLKSYTAGQPPSEPEIVFLGNQPKSQRTFPEESSRSGNFPFSTIQVSHLVWVKSDWRVHWFASVAPIGPTSTRI